MAKRTPEYPKYIAKREAAWKKFKSAAKNAGVGLTKDSFVAGYDIGYATSVNDFVRSLGDSVDEVDHGFPF